MRLRDVRRRHVQALVDRLAADGLSESRIRSVISAVRALYGYAIEQGYVELSPATGSLIPSEGRCSRRTGRTRTSRTTRPTSAGTDGRGRRVAGRASARDRGGAIDPATAPASDYQPIALLPERILSLVLRIVVVIFILFALVTIVGSASA